MKLIPDFENFENSYPLEGKITPELSEKLAEYFSESQGVNEASFIDNIKNTLSKTFLGSLSYINMIDKLRTEILKIEKEIVSKKYEHEAEIDSLKDSIKNLGKTGNTSGIEQTKKIITNKINEYQIFRKVSNTKKQQAMDIIDDIIKGNKRRSDYWHSGRTQDELEVLKFEYDIAKKKTEVDSEELKQIEEEIRKATVAAEKAAKDQEEAKRQEEEKKKREEEENKKKEEENEKKEKKDLQDQGIQTLDLQSMNWNKSLKSSKGRLEVMKMIKVEIANLEDKAEKEKGFNRDKIEGDISVLKKMLKKIRDAHEEMKNDKIPSSQTFNSMNKLGNELTVFHSKKGHLTGKK